MTVYTHDNFENIFSKQEIDFSKRSVEELLKFYKAPTWISNTRQGDIALDFERTSEYLGIPVDYEKLGHRDGLTTGIVDLGDMDTFISIKLSDRLKNTQKNLVFGHEIGHYFLATKGIYDKNIHELKEGEIERFCEAFGREYALPVSHLADIASIDESLIEGLAHIYNVDIKTVLYQLMLADRIPRTVKVDSSHNYRQRQVSHQAIICLDCENGNEHNEELEVCETFVFSDQLVFDTSRRHKRSILY